MTGAEQLVLGGGAIGVIAEGTWFLSLWRKAQPKWRVRTSTPPKEYITIDTEHPGLL